MPTKAELIQTAEDLGVPGISKVMTKTAIELAIAQHPKYDDSEYLEKPKSKLTVKSCCNCAFQHDQPRCPNCNQPRMGG